MGMCRSTWTRSFLRDGVFLVSFLTCFRTTLLLCFQTILASFLVLASRSCFSFLYLALSFRDKRRNHVREPYALSRPRVQSEAASKCFVFEYELCFESSWDMHSAVPCAALASRDIFILRAFFSSQRLIRLKLRLKTQTPISMHQAIPPDLPTSLSFLALHFSPPTQNTSQNTIHIAFAFTFTFTSAFAFAIVFLHFHPALNNHFREFKLKGKRQYANLID